MKRLLPYILLALGFHAVILSTDFSWLALAPGRRPALNSLSITLSADSRPANHGKAETRRMRQLPPKPEPDRNKNREEQPVENPVSIRPNPQQIKPIPAPPQKKVLQKPRPKKSLKSLTRKQQITKPVETVHPASADELHFPVQTAANIYRRFNTGKPPVGLSPSDDNTLIKKTHSEPAGYSEALTTAAALPQTEAKGISSESIRIHYARPLYRQNKPPGYPRRARRMGYEGLVMLKVLVDVNGQVDDLEILTSSGYPVLDQAALSSVKKWRFLPGTEDGKKKKMWVKIPIRFQLE